MADDDLAYGEYHGQGGDGETGERGFIGDTFRRFAGGRRPGPGDPQQQVRTTQCPSYLPR
jgi:hypothetical protein